MLIDFLTVLFVPGQDFFCRFVEFLRQDLLSQLSSLQQQCPAAEVSFRGVSCFVVAECGVLRLFSQVFENL